MKPNLVYNTITKRVKAFGMCDFTQPNWNGQPLCGIDDVQIESPFLTLPDEARFCVIDDSEPKLKISVDETYKVQVIAARELERGEQEKKEKKRMIVDLDSQKEKAIARGYDDVAAEIQAEIDALLPQVESLAEIDKDKDK